MMPKFLADIPFFHVKKESRMALGREESKAHQLVSGVPQGSVLGPPHWLGFSTYTTSLDPIIQAHGFYYH